MSNVDERIKAVTRLINQDPITVSLSRPVATEGAYGGATFTLSTISAQTFRLSNLPRPNVSMGTNGQVVSSSHVLLCQYNANVEAGDTFTSAGNEYEIMFVRVYPFKTECDLRLR